MPRTSPFSAAIANEIWDQKYRLKAGDGAPIDATLDDTFWRVAKAAASKEAGGKRQRAKWSEKFHDAISDFGFIPAGRILSGAGSDRNVTLFNCFVMGRIPDDLSGIFESVKQAALTMQAGGGIGHDFSTLRPRGALVRSIGADASGPVSFMDVWDAMCQTIMSAGARRGAMMGTMRVDHPDIEDFIDAKNDAARLRNFNLSVLITDAFMAAVEDDDDWDLVFDGKIYRTVQARLLWDRIMRATYDYAEPGVIFIDRINRANNLSYCEKIYATNPCGEQPLPSYGACLLGSINLAKLVTTPFKIGGDIDTAMLEERTRIAVRFLDNVIDVSSYPLKKQRKEAKAKRRIGLGITGLADALIMTGRHYDSEEGREAGERWMATIQNAAYEASIEIASEKAAFPKFSTDEFLAAPNVGRLGKSVRRGIKKHGIRNGCLTSIAPTGTISLFAGNVSSGIEPVFDFKYQRRILTPDGKARQETVEDWAHALYQEGFGPHAKLPDTFVRADDLSPQAHLSMQAALQPHVDSAISKTINCPEHISFADFKGIYATAYEFGLKGCTTYRPNEVTGAVLSHQDETNAQSETIPSTTPSPPVTAQPTTVHTIGAPMPQAHDVTSNNANTNAIVYMTEPLARTDALDGSTYKIKWPNGDQAIYVTINDIVQDGRRRPFEIFINTRNLEHYAWTVALTRMISAVFRRGGDVSFVAEELKAIFDPQGGCWVAGRYVPSLLAAIGDVIESHMLKTGALTPGQLVTALPQDKQQKTTAADAGVGPANPSQGTHKGQASQNVSTSSSLSASETHSASLAGTGNIAGTNKASDAAAINIVKSIASCLHCGALDLISQEGCLVCRQCGYSKCG
ncbi:MAG: adenosylcobalamin-dependent ribonucleoside-diphosphate reductase [Hyphomicrobiaceae bacterium]